MRDNLMALRCSIRAMNNNRRVRAVEIFKIDTMQIKNLRGYDIDADGL